MESPIIGITADASAEKYMLGRTYVSVVRHTGGIPIVLPCVIDCVQQYVGLCAGFILTGGDDPIMTQWGVPMHPKATPLDPERQAFELALLRVLEGRPEKAVLGVCLGMQLMGLHAGGVLEQHLPDVLPTADLHWGRRAHEVAGELGRGTVHSHHRQALTSPGRGMKVVASAPDGVIEAVRHEHRPFYLGVQWHPERTADEALGVDLIREMIEASRG